MKLSRWWISGGMSLLVTLAPALRGDAGSGSAAGTANEALRATPPGQVAAPELSRVTGWINSPPLTLAGLRGKVVVVHFWTYGCHNCRNNYEHYRSWSERYAGKDVVILGIHTPETASERNIKKVKQQAEKNGLRFPIAIDNDSANWLAWGNHYWPSVYLVDRNGQVRYSWEGELNYGGQKGEATVRKVIDALLLEKPTTPTGVSKE